MSSWGSQLRARVQAAWQHDVGGSADEVVVGSRFTSFLPLLPLPPGTSASSLFPRTAAVLQDSGGNGTQTGVAASDGQQGTHDSSDATETETSPLDDSSTQTQPAAEHTEPDEFDLRNVAAWISGMLPYLGLLLFVFLVHHTKQLIQLAWLLGCLLKINRMLQKKWNNWEDALHQTLMAMVFVVFHLSVCLWVTRGFALVPCLWLGSTCQTQLPSVSWTLLTVGVVDSIARLLLAVFKLPVLLVYKHWARPSRRSGTGSPPAHLDQHKRLASALALSIFNLATRFYRNLLSLPFWCTYLWSGSGLQRWSAYLATGSYLTLKTLHFVRTAYLLARAVHSAWQDHGYVRPASPEDIAATGDHCPICHDTITSGLKLSCDHCYCEECIMQWLDRDVTCPMCRKQVKVADTAFSVNDLMPRLF